jgi:spermidine/putrescine transport system ATP-binding protein
MSSEESGPVLQLRQIVKRFGDFTAVAGVDLDIPDGEFFTLVGPSGSGKTTMIRMLVGMDKPTSGEMRLRGQVINDVPANKRPTCMVFQSLALFPHKSVGENIEFPMKIAGVAPVERRKRVDALLRQLRLPESYYDKAIQQCSGGEQQRIALARALAFDPDILFFDEPLSALDYRLRKTLEKELKDLHRETGKTFVYITHSLEEAMVMSDRIGIMRDGRIVQVGSPSEIYNRPRDKFVAQFMGEVNTLEVERTGERKVRNRADGREYQVARELDGFEAGFLIVRPEVVKIGASASDLANRLSGTLFNDYSLGSRTQYQVRVDDDDAHWLVERLQDEPYEGSLGDRVDIGWRPEDSILVKD